MQKAIFLSKLETNYKYMKLPNSSEADVFIYNFIEENETEDGTEYVYEFNEFRVNTEEITEEMIAKNPSDYLDYEIIEETAEEKIATLEKEVQELKTEIQNLKG